MIDLPRGDTRFTLISVILGSLEVFDFSYSEEDLGDHSEFTIVAPFPSGNRTLKYISKDHDIPEKHQKAIGIKLGSERKIKEHVVKYSDL